MPFIKIIFIYADTGTKNIDAHCGQNKKVSNVEALGTYSNYRASSYI
jgi:hypothetical protein